MTALRRAVVIAALLFATAALGQVGESITVEVIEVPVYVTAAGGTPIRGLTKEAFSLFVNGKQRAIDYFEAVDLAAASPTPAEGQARVPVLHQRRLYLLLFDLAFTRPGLIERAKNAADAAVLRSNPSTDYFAVATFRHGEGLRFVIPFLNDYVAVRRAVATLQSNDVKDPLGVGLTSKQRKTWTEIEGRSQGLPLAVGFRTGDPYVDEIIEGGEVNQELSRQMLRDDVEQQFAGLGAVAARLAAMEGQKHVVIFSAGFSNELFVDRGRGYQEDPQMHRFLLRMADAFRAAGAFLDSIDVVGNRSADASESLRRISEPTGGETIRNTNDLAAAFTRLTASHDAVYLLGFRRGDATAGTIDVRVAGLPRDARLSFRTGFGKPAPQRDLDPLQLADIVINDIPQNGLSLKLEATPQEISILFRPPEVVAQLLPAKPYVEAMLYVFDEHGGTALFRSKRLPFDAKQAPKVNVAGVREGVSLPPGRYVVKALLHVAGTQSVGFARSELLVP
ncbi:MAG TPA: VWA domain-containing protein [Thermoanaerobaculia bacterium]